MTVSSSASIKTPNWRVGPLSDITRVDQNFSITREGKEVNMEAAEVVVMFLVRMSERRHLQDAAVVFSSVC